MSKEKITLNEDQKEQWEGFRSNALQRLVTEALQVNDVESIRYFVEVGISRAFDQRYSTADKKLVLIETGKIPSLAELIPKGSEKQQLIREIATKQNILTPGMLKKFSLNELKKLAEKL